MIPIRSLAFSLLALAAATPSVAQEAGLHLVPGATAAPETAAPAVATPTTPAEAPALTTGAIAPEAPPADADIGAAARLVLGPKPVLPEVPPADAAAATAAVTTPPAPPPKFTPEERDLVALHEFYDARRDAPLWVGKTGWLPGAVPVIAELKRAGDWGLDPRAYEIEPLAEAREGAPDLARETLARAEANLSLAVLAYSRHARGGRIAEPSKQLSSYFDRRPQVRDRKRVLEEIATTSDPAAYLAGLQPQHPEFERLRQAWLEARRFTEKRIQKIPNGPDLRPGDRDPQVALLRKRFGIEAASADGDTLYDERLADAVKRWQGLRGAASPDGIVTNALRADLYKMPKGNADQLYANMEMWRYMPDDLGAFHAFLNVPEYEIHIVKDGQEVFHERVTTGLVSKQTPIFSDAIELVTIKSKWRVPDSIKVREVWPSLLRGGGMMRQHGLVMLNLEGQEVDWRRIDWSKVSMKDYTLWQPPGPKNQLGLVKFSFPNKHYVFMHDTPDKHMFSWRNRAVSHGCMRIRNPLEMARVLLAEDKGPEWTRDKIDDLVKSGPEHNIITLDRKVPVHITYFTARVTEKGEIRTWPDIYGHERRFRQALSGKWDQIAVGHDHLAPLDQDAVPRVAAKGPPARARARGKSASDDFLSAFLGGM